MTIIKTVQNSQITNGGREGEDRDRQTHTDRDRKTHTHTERQRQRDLIIKSETDPLYKELWTGTCTALV